MNCSKTSYGVQVRHVPRTENSRADALAKLATTLQEDLDRRVSVEHLIKPSINVNSDEVLPVMTVSSWMDPIWDYLLNGTLPSDSKEASKREPDQPDSFFYEEPFRNGDFLHPFSNA